MNTTFYLNRRKDSKPSDKLTIMCEVRYTVGGQVLRLPFSTKERIEAKYFKAQRAVGRYLFSTEVNSRLADIEKAAKHYYNVGCRQKRFFSKLEYKQKILAGIFYTEPQRDVWQDWDSYLFYQESRGKYMRSLRYGRNKCLKFCQEQNRQMTYKDFNAAFYERYVRWLRALEHKTNTIGALVNKIKMFLQWAYDEDFNDFSYFKKFGVFKEDKEVVYLDTEEMELWERVKLPPALEETRDWFVVASEVGFRYDSYDKFTKKNMAEVSGGYTFTFKAAKKGARATVPLSKKVISILLKYGMRMPTPKSNQAMNRDLKKIAARCKIPKVVTTHTARRTFATLRYYEGWPVPLLMQITGKKTESQFFIYIGIDPNDATAHFRKSEAYQIDVKGLLDSRLKVG